jgi:hypothetical protein
MATFPSIGRALPAFAVATTLATASLTGLVLAATVETSATSAAASGRYATNAVEDRITRLQHQLQITPAEISQWNAVAQAMRDNAQAVHNISAERARDQATMTALDDLRSYEALSEAHAEGIKTLLPAFETLYAGMSDRQKKNADLVFGRFDRPHRHNQAS